jgi:NADPH:quinone reductase-like Zn-dependent oxidoreductase
MDQLAQKLKDGRMEVLEVPIPALAAGNVLVRNLYSLVLRKGIWWRAGGFRRTMRKW